MKKFKEYDKKYQKFRIYNYLFSIVMTIIMLSRFAYMTTIVGFPASIRYLGPIFHIAIIYVIQLVLRYRVSNFVLLFYNIYVFFGSVLGTGFDFYEFRYYDDVMHTIFGYVGGILGLYLLVKLGDYPKMSTAFVMVMIMFITLGCAAIWEIMENFCDNVFKTTAQGPKVNGIVDLTDTMQDIIDAVYGLVVFEIHYFIHRRSKKKLMIGNMIDEFTNN